MPKTRITRSGDHVRICVEMTCKQPTGVVSGMSTTFDIKWLFLWVRHDKNGTVMSMSITWWSLVNSPLGRVRGGWIGVGRLVDGGGGGRWLMLPLDETIRAHFGQYPPEHQHTSITTWTSRLTRGKFEQGSSVMWQGVWKWWVVVVRCHLEVETRG